jgi:hypothetical protein
MNPNRVVTELTRLITSQIIPSFVYPKGTYELKGAKSNANMPAANFFFSHRLWIVPMFLV